MERDSYQLNAHLKELKPYLLEGLRAGQEYVGLWCDQVGVEDRPTLQWSLGASHEPHDMIAGGTSECLVFESQEESHPLIYPRHLDVWVRLIDSSFCPEPLLAMRGILATGDWIRRHVPSFTDGELSQVITHMNDAIPTAAPYVLSRGTVIEVAMVSPVMDRGRSNAKCFVGQFFRSVLELLKAIKLRAEDDA